MDTEGNCKVCETRSTLRCGNCQTVFYCSRDHQKQDWKTHKTECVPARVKTSPTVGRYLEATRDFKVGDVIFREKALLIVPTKGVCFGCHQELHGKFTIPCRKCGIPVCSQKCADSDNHMPECGFLMRRRYSDNNLPFALIAVIRVLHHKRNDTKLWNKLKRLEYHLEYMKKFELWKELREDSQLREIFSEEDILRCCGIVQVNGFEILKCLIGIYNMASMLEHNCRPNCHITFSSEGDTIVIAGTDVSAGSHLSICYTDPMWGTDARRHHLAETKFFDCSCERCSDPTEFGTMFNAVKCHDILCEGYLLPEKFLDHIHYDLKNKSGSKFWICDTCKLEVKEEGVQILLNKISAAKGMLKEEVKEITKFINSFSKIVHPNHYIITEMTMLLIRKIRCDNCNWNVETWSLKIKLYKKVLGLLEILAPASISLRGCMLYHLSGTLVAFGIEQFDSEGPLTTLTFVTESVNIIKESVDMLRNEPDNGTVQGNIAKDIKSRLVTFQKLSSKLKTMHDTLNGV